MDIEKKVKGYAKLYRRALAAAEIPDTGEKSAAYEKRLSEMYASDDFERYSQYPTTDASHVYAVIAMCLELKRFDLSEPRIIDVINSGFRARRDFFRRLLRCIDLLPNAYRLAGSWISAEHDRRVKDGSLTFDYFTVSEGKVEYCISRCVYIEMFEQYGIRSLCRLFCMTDTAAYENLPRHVRFIRHSALSDGSCCHDEIIDKRRIKG